MKMKLGKMAEKEHILGWKPGNKEEKKHDDEQYYDRTLGIWQKNNMMKGIFFFDPIFFLLIRKSIGIFDININYIRITMRNKK